MYLQKAAWYANGERHHIFKVKSFHAILHAAGSLLIHRTRARKEAGLEDVPIAAMMEGCLADALIERELKRLPMEKKKVGMRCHVMGNGFAMSRARDGGRRVRELHLGVR